MPTAAISAEAIDQRKPALMRWAMLMCVSLLLHLIVLGWAGGKLAVPATHAPQQDVVLAQLAPNLLPPQAAKPKIPRKPAVKKTVERKTQSSPPAPAAVAAQDSSALTAIGPDETAVGAQAHSKQAAPEKVHIFEQGDAADSAFYYISLPPSALLKYDVLALRQGQTVHGHGQIAWQSDGYRYSVDGEAGILFFNVFRFNSKGLVDESGISPEIYAEKRLRKAETNTHFHRERKLISFSASTRSYPRQGGEQDRASIIWQLAGMGRGGGDSFAPGADIQLFVAGVRDAEIWVIRVLGEEDIETAAGKTRAWHLVRQPREGSYDQKIDIWLSPEQQWYPVKIRYTETNGEYLEMSLSELVSTAAQAAGPQ